MSTNQRPIRAFILSFIFPFVLAGGFWGYLTWGHAIDDAGRDGRTLDAFDREATLPALKAFVLDGLGWGVGGLVVCYVAFKLTGRTNAKHSDSN